MGLLEHLEKLINEHGSASILREHLALVKAEQSAIQRHNADLQSQNEALKSENKQLRMQVSALKKQMASINSMFVCDHCGSSNLVRVGNRPDPTFGDLGIKQSVFRCADCNLESAFTPPGS